MGIYLMNIEGEGGGIIIQYTSTCYVFPFFNAFHLKFICFSKKNIFSQTEREKKRFFFHNILRENNFLWKNTLLETWTMNIFEPTFGFFRTVLNVRSRIIPRCFSSFSLRSLNQKFKLITIEKKVVLYFSALHTIF